MFMCTIIAFTRLLAIAVTLFAVGAPDYDASAVEMSELVPRAVVVARLARFEVGPAIEEDVAALNRTPSALTTGNKSGLQLFAPLPIVELAPSLLSEEKEEAEDEVADEAEISIAASRIAWAVSHIRDIFRASHHVASAIVDKTTSSVDFDLVASQLRGLARISVGFAPAITAQISEIGLNRGYLRGTAFQRQAAVDADADDYYFVPHPASRPVDGTATARITEEMVRDGSAVPTSSKAQTENTSRRYSSEASFEADRRTVSVTSDPLREAETEDPCAGLWKFQVLAFLFYALCGAYLEKQSSPSASAPEPPATVPVAVDPYKVLGVSKGADLNEIRRKYHKLCVKLHPDKTLNKSEAEREILTEVFLLVQYAYEKLTKEANDSDDRA